MGEANEGRSSGMRHLSLQMDKYPRDLLQRFTASNTKQSQYATRNEQDEEEDEEAAASDEIELNLGLSLGGRFGVDKNAKKLIRSSSVASSIPIPRDTGRHGDSSARIVSDTHKDFFPSDGNRRGVEEEKGVTNVEEDGGEEKAVGETEEHEYKDGERRGWWWDFRGREP
ncbi:hypothetical protein L1049_005567 [Liquidambar formosana]|uniref:Ninja-family protein n=1 Tax=Liquidambar formosana TaxID=63359 RepID=A0AAP0RDY7_LIQFO